jgi:hypothetical protein
MSDSIVLASSASANDFPQNTNSSFRVKLAENLDLSAGEFEVALKTAFIPNKFFNISQATLTYIDEDNSQLDYQFSQGFYPDATTLVHKFNADARLKSFKSRDLYSAFQLSYDDIHKKITIHVTAATGSFKLSQDFLNVFGFPSPSSFSYGNTTSENLCNPYFDMSYLMIYSNLVRGRLVGDVKTNLLSVIPTHGIYGDTFHEFLHLDFVEAAPFNGDIIQIDIRTDSNNPAPFVDGKVLLTVEIRRRSRN